MCSGKMISDSSFLTCRKCLQIGSGRRNCFASRLAAVHETVSKCFDYKWKVGSSFELWLFSIIQKASGDSRLPFRRRLRRRRSANYANPLTVNANLSLSVSPRFSPSPYRFWKYITQLRDVVDGPMRIRPRRRTANRRQSSPSGIGRFQTQMHCAMRCNLYRLYTEFVINLSV